MNDMKWVDRKFNFEYNELSFDGLIDRLMDLSIRVERRLMYMPLSNLMNRPNGKWSILEHAGHLADLDSLWMIRIQNIIRGDDELAVPDDSMRADWGKDSHLQSPQEIVSQIKKERNQLVRLCQQHQNESRNKSSLHPRSKQAMRLIDLMYFIAEHDDHHLGAMRRVAVSQPGDLDAHTNDQYILGSHPHELRRLGFQHQVWDSEARKGWQLAGFSQGQTLLDLACGPGFASQELAYIVGSSGRIIAADLSENYLNFLADLAERQQLNIDVLQGDMSQIELENESLDGVYCRWALAWPTDPEVVLSRVWEAMKPGAHFVAHEYFDWSFFQTEPVRPAIQTALTAALKSFHDAGGDINIGRKLPRLFTQMGGELKSIRPMTKLAQPKDLVWYWPETFLKLYLPSLVAAEYLTAEQATSALTNWFEIKTMPHALVYAPQMMEIIVQKK